MNSDEWANAVGNEGDHPNNESKNAPAINAFRAQWSTGSARDGTAAIRGDKGKQAHHLIQPPRYDLG